MSKDRTIWEAGEIALKKLGGIGSIDEIYNEIIHADLYSFGVDNESTAVHILDIELKRKSSNTPRSDSSIDKVFEMVSYRQYRILSEEEQLIGMKKSKASGTKRIHRAKDKENIISALMADKVGVFKEIWRLLLFAAQLGYQNQRRDKLLSIDSGKGIDQTTFGNCPSWPGLTYLIGLVEKDASDVLQGTAEAEDERLEIFQEYANGGLALLEEFFVGRLVNIDGLVDLLYRQNNNGMDSHSVDLDLSI